MRTLLHFVSRIIGAINGTAAGVGALLPWACDLGSCSESVA